jgi:hypothetical protein
MFGRPQKRVNSRVWTRLGNPQVRFEVAPMKLSATAYVPTTDLMDQVAEFR